MRRLIQDKKPSGLSKYAKLWAEEIPDNVRVSGHVYDLDTGLVTTIVDAKSRK